MLRPIECVYILYIVEKLGWIRFFQTKLKRRKILIPGNVEFELINGRFNFQ